MTSIGGNSPLTVTGLDPGITYTVIVNVFNGNQVVLRDYRVMSNITVMGNITVMDDQSGKSSCKYILLYIAIERNMHLLPIYVMLLLLISRVHNRLGRASNLAIPYEK